MKTLAGNVSFNMSYILVLWIKIWQIFIPSRLELLKTHHCALYSTQLPILSLTIIRPLHIISKTKNLEVPFVALMFKCTPVQQNFDHLVYTYFNQWDHIWLSLVSWDWSKVQMHASSTGRNLNDLGLKYLYHYWVLQ